MAEILVEPDNRDPNRNNKPSIWPWILGALLLIGLVWAVVALTGDDDRDRVATTTAVDRENVTDETYRNDTYAGTAATGPVAEFIRFANDDDRYERDNVTNRDNADVDQTTTAETADASHMGIEHGYTSEGIQKLSAALNALADNSADDVNINQQRERFRQNADKIQQDPQSLQHANTIRQTFVEASALMASIKERNYADSGADVDDVREAAEDIDGSTPTLDQKDKIKEFFSKAGDAIEAMASESNTNLNQDAGVNTNDINR